MNTSRNANICINTHLLVRPGHQSEVNFGPPRTIICYAQIHARPFFVKYSCKMKILIQSITIFGTICNFVHRVSALVVRRIRSDPPVSAPQSATENARGGLLSPQRSLPIRVDPQQTLAYLPRIGGQSATYFH